MNIKIILCDETLCCLVESYKHFGEPVSSIFRVEDLKMEAAGFTDTMIISCQTTRRHVPEESNLDEAWRYAQLDNNCYVVGRDIVSSDLARVCKTEIDSRLVQGLFQHQTGSEAHTVFSPSAARGAFPQSKAVEKVS
jgi:hypothetical protein